MTKISIGTHEFEIRDVLLMKHLVKVNLFDLITLAEDFKDNEKKMKLIGDLNGLVNRMEPLLTATIIEGPEIEELTMAEYINLMMHPAVMGAFTKSMEGMPELPLPEISKKVI